MNQTNSHDLPDIAGATVSFPSDVFHPTVASPPDDAIVRVTREEYLNCCSSIAATAGTSSVFNSRAWLSTWFEVFGHLNPEFYKLRADGADRACWSIIRRDENWHGIPLRRVYLDATGEDDADGIYAGYHNLICLPEYAVEACRSIWRVVNRKPWDELRVPRALPGMVYHLALSSGRSVDIASHVFRFIDLAALRGTGEPYLNSLSKDARRHVRQALRAYAAHGPITIKEAESVSEAKAFHAALSQLHQEYWVSRGQPGAFASSRFSEFHRRLIDTAFPSGVLQLLRVSAGDFLIGYLYNFVDGASIRSYQYGLNYAGRTSNHHRPGYVLVATVLEYLMQRGYAEYDMLAGDFEYKRWLTTDSRELLSAVFYRPTVRTALVRAAIGLRNLRPGRQNRLSR